VPLIEWNASTWSLIAEDPCGDRRLVKIGEDWALGAAVDGLGHGAEAASAAEAAVALLETYAGEPPIRLVERCHEGLRKSRGVVMSLASFNGRDHTMTWLGVGNVEGVLLRQDQRAHAAREMILLRGGIVGYQLPPLRAATVPVIRGDTLVFATDGVREGFTDGVTPSQPTKEILDSICATHRKGTDDGLVVVARYLGGGP